MRGSYFNPSRFNAFRLPVAAFVPLWLLTGAASFASAQNARNAAPSETGEWAQGAIDHAQQMRIHKDSDQGSQPTPPIIKKLDIDDDPGGRIATFQPGVATITANNAFFQNLGTNGRTCDTCHQKQNGWTVSAADVRDRFADSAGTDPIFRLVDGATCPTDNVSTLGAKRRAYKLLLDKGLIRIGLPLPSAPNLEFSVASVDDPYGCTTNPATGLTSPTTGIVSMYRRPLPSTNLGFLTTIMWDGRESNLAQQGIDATLIHAQATAAPTADQQKQIVDFETGIFTAQIFDDEAGSLHARGATGGPIAALRSSGCDHDSAGIPARAAGRRGLRPALGSGEFRWRRPARAARQGRDAQHAHPLLGDELRALRRLQRESVPSPFVFVSERGTPFTTAGFARMIERAAASRRVRQRNCFCCGRGHVEYLLRYEDQAWASNSPGLEAIGRRVAWSKAGHPPLLAPAWPPLVRGLFG